MVRPRFEPIALALTRQVSAATLIPLQGVKARLCAPDEVEEAGRWANFTECHSALQGAARQLLGAPQFAKLSQLFETLKEEFQPAGPPHSPLYESELWQMILGQCPEGLAAETPYSVLARLLEARAERAFLAPLARSMASCHWKLYRASNVHGTVVQLQSLRSEEMFSVVQGSTWLKPADLLMARLLRFGSSQYLIDIPYLLVSSEQDWRLYLQRVEERGSKVLQVRVRPAGLVASRRRRKAPVAVRDWVAEHFRIPLSSRFWLDFAVAAYAGERDGVVRLHGLPDRPESQPHHDIR